MEDFFRISIQKYLQAKLSEFVDSFKQANFSLIFELLFCRHQEDDRNNII